MSEPFYIARVIAALDAAGHDDDLLPAAVELAGRLQAEIAGLFIEDENLLRLWASPAVRHVTLGAVRDLPSTEQIEAELRALAAQAEAALAAAATRHGVPWSFRVVRGRPKLELHESTKTKDLVVVGRSRSLAGMPLQLASALQEAARDLPLSTLHLLRQTTLARPIALIRPGSPLADRALAAALRLAGGPAPELDVLLIGDTTDPAPQKTEIASRLKALGARARVRVMSMPSLDELSRALATADGDVLVAAADIPLFRDRDDLSMLLERTRLPVLIVRG
ncbi:MAG TPA: hypothetical protein VMH36_11575 [Alphaproteobacteria bacterium]|nr:hypothetical protein [Alphaproteobacteria bacterium]